MHMKRRDLLAFTASLLAIPASIAGAAGDEAILTMSPAGNAPQAVKDMKVFIGDWKCRGHRQTEDGEWEPLPWRSDWKWRYVLDGHAVQDFFYPAKESGGTPGTNLRVYDVNSNSWNIAWTTTSLGDFERIQSRFDGETMILHGSVEASARYAAHERRITFHNISSNHFDWKYEAAKNRKSAEDGRWQLVSKLVCDRAAAINE